MSNFSALIATIQAYIKTNGNEEITGAVLQDVLEAMVQALGTEAINNLETALSNEVGNRQNADTALGNAIGAIEDAIENGYVYAGIATPSSTPVSGKVFYLTAQAGTYTNFGGVTVTAGITILKYNGSAWVVEQLISMADIYRNPLMGYYECSTAGSTDAKTVNATGYVLPTTGGTVKIKMDNRNTVANATLQIGNTAAKPLYYNGTRVGVGNTWDTNEIIEVFYDGTNYQACKWEGGNNDGVFDISAYNLTNGQPTPYIDLAAALGTSGEHVPDSYRKGGMSVKFIQGSVSSSDNKYVQYMYNGIDTTGTPNPFLNISNWEKINLEKELNQLGKEVALWESLEKTQWDGKIKELYISPVYYIESALYLATSNSTVFVIGAKVSNTYNWFARCNPTEDNKIYDLVIYNGTGIGQIIGKVVFNDYYSILENTYLAEGNILSWPYVSNISNHPMISVASSPEYVKILQQTFTDNQKEQARTNIGAASDADLALLDEKVDFVNEKADSIDAKVELWKSLAKTQWVGAIRELYVSPSYHTEDALYIVNASSSNGIVTVTEKGDITSNWIAKCSPTENNIIYELVVYSGGHIGEVIGKIVFNDYQSMISNTDLGPNNILSWPYISNISNHPIISASLTSEFVKTSSQELTNIQKERARNNIGAAASSDIQSSLPSFHIAKKIYCVSGDKNLLFTRGIIHAVNPYLWSSKFVCSATPEQVHPFPRYLQINFENSTTKDLTLQLISNDYHRSNEQESQIIVKSPSSPSNNINVLCFGSSTTTDGVWAGELKRRLCGSGGSPEGNNLSNITFVGRTDGSVDSSVKVEGISGWSWRLYMNGVAAKKFVVAPGSIISIYTRYTYTDIDGGTATVSVLDYDSALGEVICVFNNSASTKNPAATGVLVPVNGGNSVAYTSWTQITAWTPFIDNGNFGFQTYANKYCGGKIDVIICNLSYLNENNGEDNDMTVVMEDVKDFVDQLHLDFPSCKILITTCIGASPFGGAGYNYGASASYTNYGFLFGEWTFQEKLEEFVGSVGYSDFCFMVNSLQEVDMENAFPTTTTPLNLRSNETEIVQTNALHPNTAGSYMTADSVYRCFVCTCLNP